jgi:hypothetical protein
MSTNTLFHGASYGGHFGTKLTTAGHHAMFVCRQVSADLMNAKQTNRRVVRSSALTAWFNRSTA